MLTHTPPLWAARYRDVLASPQFQCPACRKAETDLATVLANGWTCPKCGDRWSATGGVVHALTPDFLAQAAGRGRAPSPRSEAPACYLDLPFQQPCRAAAYRCFERKVLAPLERAANRPLSVLDLGAGVAWLSYRLCLRGHWPIAVDLLDDPLDGLGAARHYPREFPLIQAEFDRVPLAEQQFDLAVFNASFHCATDYRATLREVRRLLGWGGRVAILDTPVYESFVQGEQAREHRHAELERKYGRRPDSLLSMEYLDDQMIRRLGDELNIQWRRYRPWYGVRQYLGPLRAKLARRQPPSRREILLGSWTGG